MSFLNKEIRITAVDAGVGATVDRISDDIKKKLSSENTDVPIGEIIAEAESKFKSVSEQVRFIAEELNKLKVDTNVFEARKREIETRYDPTIREQADKNQWHDLNNTQNRKKRELNQVDKDEKAQEEVNKHLVDVLEKLVKSIDKQEEKTRQFAQTDEKNRERQERRREEAKTQRGQIEFEKDQEKTFYRQTNQWSKSSEGRRLIKEQAEAEGYDLDEESESSGSNDNNRLQRGIMGQRVGGLATHLTGNSAVGEGTSALIEGGLSAGPLAVLASIVSILVANNQLTNKTGRLSGMTGMSDEDIENEYQKNGKTRNGLTDATQLGKSYSEMMDYDAPIAQARGSANGVVDAGLRQLRLEKAFGLNEGRLAGTDTYSRADNPNSGTQDATQQISLFIQEMRAQKQFGFGQGDFTQLNEKISQFERFTALQANRSEIADQRMSIKMIEAGGEIGGSFADQRAGDQFGKLDAAIASPQGNFQQAYIMNRIHNANPDESYFDTRKRMEKGLFGEGNMKALLGGVNPQGSSKEAMDDYYLRIQNLTHLSFSASEMLGKKIQSDSTFLDRYSRGDEQAKKEIDLVDNQGRTTQQRGSDNVGNLTSSWSTTKSVIETFLPAIGHSLEQLVIWTHPFGQPVVKNNKTK